MTRLSIVFAILAVSMAAGVVYGWGQRGKGERSYATFVAFVAALIATIFELILYTEPMMRSNAEVNISWQGFNFLGGIVAIACIAAAFFAGLFSFAMKRVVL
jgi:hypothetical protein